MKNLNFYLFGTVFITGAGVLILEVAAVRLLSPYYGSSLYVFSSVLTVILAALSFGYWVGGRRADRKHSLDDLFQIITLSGLLVLMLEWLAIVWLPSIALTLGPKIGPLVFSLGLFFVPAFLLGTVSPYIIKIQSLHTSPGLIGSVVGQTFFWGTAGSIVGSLLTGFWLIPRLGVQKTILLVAVTLIALGVIMPLILKRRLKTSWVVFVFSAAAILLLGVKTYAGKLGEDYLYSGEGIYSSIKIQDRSLDGQTIRTLNRDTNNSSAIYLHSDELVYNYAKFALLYETLKPDAENFLMLGGGAYTVPRSISASDPDLLIDVVEIEPVLYELAQTYFDFTPTDQISNYAMDARVFLHQTDQQYDVIFADTFGTDLAAPFHLTTLEFYQLAQSRLKADGVLIMNYVGAPKGTRPSLTGSVAKTLLTVFSNTKAYALRADSPRALQNIIFISRNGSAEIDLDKYLFHSRQDTTVELGEIELDLNAYQTDFEYLLTDDHAPVEYLMEKQR